jgi:hypothetical protein
MRPGGIETVWRSQYGTGVSLKKAFPHCFYPFQIRSRTGNLVLSSDREEERKVNSDRGKQSSSVVV